MTGIRATGRDLDLSLLRFVERGELEKARAALAKGANPNGVDYAGRSAALVAASCAQPDCLRLVLEAGASPLSFDLEGDGALWLACAAQSAACVRLLLAAGCPPDHTQEEESLFPPLIVACLNGAGECAELLIQAGANTSSFGMGGMLPVHFAARCMASGGASCVALLAAAGVDINALDQRGFTPLDCAYEAACPMSFALLLSLAAQGKCLASAVNGPAPFPFCGPPDRVAERLECERALRVACERREIELDIGSSCVSRSAKRASL